MGFRVYRHPSRPQQQASRLHHRITPVRVAVQYAQTLTVNAVAVLVTLPRSRWLCMIRVTDEASAKMMS